MPDLIQKSSESEPLKKLPKDSKLKKLIKIFRTNTVVKHHFQSGRSDKPVGVAKAFFKNGYNFQSSVIPGYEAYDRFARYSDYSEAESYPTIAQALNIVADEVTQKDEDGKIIKVISENKDIQKILTELFDDILHLNGKEIYKLVRALCKYGDVFYLIDADEEHGVLNLIFMPANEIEREEGFDKDEMTAVRFRWTARSNTSIPNAYVAHFRLDGNDLFKPYGTSFIEAARRPWRQLVLLEDAMMVYRITRAPERRVYYLDMMGIPPENVDEVVNEFNKTIKKHKIVDEDGKIDLRFGAAMTLEEDLIIPVRGGDTATRIDTLPGGQNASDIDDIEFIRKNLFSALGIPKAFLTFDEDVGAKSVLTQEDIRFARTVARIQEAIINELLKIAIIHLYLKGVRGDDLVNFEIRMTNPSTVAELQKTELWRARMELVQAAGEGVFDTTFIYKNFLHLTDEAIDLIRKGQIQDKIFQSKLMQIEMSSGGGMGMGLGMGMGGGMMGGGMMGGMGGTGMDLGGAAPNVSGMPPLPMESFNPAAEVLSTNNPTQRKDLSRRNSDERIATDRGVPKDEIVNSTDVSDSTSGAFDTDGIRRTYDSPMGANESIKSDLKDILKEYRHISSMVNGNIMDDLFYKEMPFLRPTSRKATYCNSINEDILTETFGGSVYDKSTLLKENISTRKLLKESAGAIHAESVFGPLEEKMNAMEKKAKKLFKSMDY